jgi:hypothetical protein
MSMQTLHLKPHTAAPATLTAQRLKVTIVLNASEVLHIPAPDGVPRTTMRILLPDRTVTAEIATKSLRKAQAAIRDVGGDGVVVVLQGRLVAGDVIAEAGLAAQLKQPKAQ